MPGLAVGQCHGLPALSSPPHSLHSTGNWRKREMLSESSHSKHSELQTNVGGVEQVWETSRGTSNVSDSHCKAWSSDQTSTHLLQGALHLISGLSHTTFHNKYLYFSETIHLCSSLHFFTVRYAMLAHGFILVICQLILRAYI